MYRLERLLILGHSSRQATCARRPARSLKSLRCHATVAAPSVEAGESNHSKPLSAPSFFDRHESAKDSELRRQYSPDARKTPETLEVQEVLNSRQIHPADILRQRLPHSKAPLDLVRICLHAYYKDVVPKRWPERIALIKQKPIADIALQYMWKDDAAWVDLVLHDFDAQFKLCFFAIVEGLGDLIVDWVKVDLTPAITNLMTDRESSLWRGVLFRSVIKAHQYTETTRTADSALREFLKMLDLKRKVRDLEGHSHGANRQESSPLLRMSLFPAHVELGTILGRSPLPHTNPEMYDEFIEYLQTVPTRYRDDFSDTVVALHHPSRPDARPLTAYLRARFEGKSEEEVRLSAPSKTLTHKVMSAAIWRGVQVSRFQALSEDLEYLEHIAGVLRCQETTSSTKLGWRGESDAKERRIFVT